MEIKDPREQAQVRAAMRFWELMANTNGRHPSRHPVVIAELDGYLPMNRSEIRTWLDEGPGREQIPATIPQWARHVGIAERRLRRWVRQLGIGPKQRRAGVDLYNCRDLWRASRAAFEHETKLSQSS